MRSWDQIQQILTLIRDKLTMVSPDNHKQKMTYGALGLRYDKGANLGIGQKIIFLKRSLRSDCLN